MFKKYDVIVIGGGHAGCEAAFAASRLGASTLLLTMNIDTIALASCNPAVGGLGKGQLVYEIDALGGVISQAADANAIHSRMLNESKGIAVQGLRVQIDKWQYSSWMRSFLENQPNLEILMGMATKILFRSDGINKQVTGIELENGVKIEARTLILTTGTFLDGLIYNGHVSFPGGRCGERNAPELSKSFDELGIKYSRLKTGTPPRLHRDSIDWDELQLQPCDPAPHYFHYATESHTLPQVPCYITETNKNTHQIIRDNLKSSAMYGGVIHSVGPRYCPSIEDKVVRFPNRDSHHIFLEPEGLRSKEIYANGLSSSLPPDVQIAFLKTMKGLSHVHVTRFAYAIEYTYVTPEQLKSSLESMTVSGLFMAGQINGTTGYEEAAGLGLIAGTNAVRSLRDLEPLTFSRDTAYLGVMIDDLRTREHKEPYRMLTSRAEYRLLLRQDNADLRLCEKAYKFGLIDQTRYNDFCVYRQRVDREIERLKTTYLRTSELNSSLVEEYHLDRLTHGLLLSSFLCRPEISYEDLRRLGLNDPELATHSKLNSKIIEQVVLSLKYEPYISRSYDMAERAKELEGKHLSADLDYANIHGLRHEAVQKLLNMKPETIGQAARIPGVNPTDIQQILVYLKLKSVDS